MNKIIKRVFVTGPAGSFYSGCDGRLRDFFKATDNTDVTPQRQWIISKDNIVHRGAYFNQGNEFSDWICNFHKYNRKEILEVLDSVFDDQSNKDFLIRFHKSELFALHLDQIHEQFPDAAIITVNNDPWRCFANWFISGGYEIKYDAYPHHVFDKNYEHMWEYINHIHSSINMWNRKNKLELESLNKKFVKKYFNVDYTDKFYNSTENMESYPNTLYNPKEIKGLMSTIKLSIIPWKDI
jgi:hypothetical protein